MGVELRPQLDPLDKKLLSSLCPVECFPVSKSATVTKWQPG